LEKPLFIIKISYINSIGYEVQNTSLTDKKEIKTTTFEKSITKCQIKKMIC
jgi:hypothetical protein